MASLRADSSTEARTAKVRRTTGPLESVSDPLKEKEVLLPHAQTLAQARSYVAALADRALTLEASSAYERALLELDRVHGDECPALDTEDLTDDRDILLAVASNAIEELESYG